MVGNSPRNCGPDGQWLGFIFIWWGIVLMGSCPRTVTWNRYMNHLSVCLRNYIYSYVNTQTRDSKKGEHTYPQCDIHREEGTHVDYDIIIVIVLYNVM